MGIEKEPNVCVFFSLSDCNRIWSHRNQWTKTNLFSWNRKSITINVGNKYIKWANHLQQWWCTVLEKVYDSLYSDQKLHISNWMKKQQTFIQNKFISNWLVFDQLRANQPEMTENTNACTLKHFCKHLCIYILYHKKFFF